MKKQIFMMSMLISLGMFSACSSDDEMNINVNNDVELIPDDGEVLNPVDLFEIQNRETNSNVLASFYFFNEQLPFGKRSESFFVGSDKDECYVINNIQELKNIYRGNVSLPEIDFERFTLVIGQEIISNLYPLINQNLEFHDKQCELKLYIPDFDGDTTALQYYLYYWALYPKFNTNGISVSYVKEGSVMRSVKDVTGNLHYDKQADGWFVSYSVPGTIDSVDIYYILNLPDEFKVNKDKGTRVYFSGYVIEMSDDAREALGKTPMGGYSYYFVYLTHIE